MIALVPSIGEVSLSGAGYVLHAVQRARLTYSAGDDINPSGPMFLLQSWCGFEHEVPDLSYSDAAVIDCPECLRRLR